MIKNSMFAALAVSAALPAQAASLVTNGSFESPLAFVDYYYVGSTAISGYTVVQLPTGDNNVQLTDNSAFGGIGAYASDGNQFLDLTGNIGRGAGIQTDAFATVLGQRYIAAFDVGAFNIAGNSFGDATVDVYLNGVFANSFTQVENQPGQGTQYTRFSYNFLGTGAPTTLAFYSSLSPTSSNLGVAFDNLDVAAVPEPATWALSIIGFGAMGAAMRRRRGDKITAVRYG